ncbi:MAG: hypothetical protein JRJ20_03925 [Deltaproteobacteria bacterium]|nr:hypothetical protein [Deltaproteobacteria bacterium]
MSLILYGRKYEDNGVRFGSDIKTLISENEVEILNTPESLAKRLLQVSFRQSIVVIMTKEREELVCLLPIVHLLRKARVILVVPDQEPETIKIGYKLEPRFLKCGDNDFTEIRAVLKNMLQGDKCNIKIQRQVSNRSQVPFFEYEQNKHYL